MKPHNAPRVASDVQLVGHLPWNLPRGPLRTVASMTGSQAPRSKDQPTEGASTSGWAESTPRVHHWQSPAQPCRPLSSLGTVLGIRRRAFFTLRQMQLGLLRYMHACMHACMHTFIHTCIHAYIHAYIYTVHTVHKVHTYIHTYSTYSTYITYIHACIHTYIHAYIHTYMHIYIPCMHTYIHTYIIACMHAYIHTCIHTCTHICVHGGCRFRSHG